MDLTFLFWWRLCHLGQRPHYFLRIYLLHLMNGVTNSGLGFQGFCMFLSCNVPLLLIASGKLRCM
jgi:hypothetical protein